MIEGVLRTGSDLTPHFRKEAALKPRCPNCGALLEVAQRVGDDRRAGFICRACKWHRMETDFDVPYDGTDEYVLTSNTLFEGMTREDALQGIGAGNWRDFPPGYGRMKERAKGKEKAEAKTSRCRMLAPDFNKRT